MRTNYLTSVIIAQCYTCRSLDKVNSLVLILDNGICCKLLYLGCICLQEGIIEQCMSHYTLGWVAGCACVLWSYWERHNHCSSYVSFSFCGFLLLCWFLRFSWQSLTRRWLRRRRFGTDVHNLPFPIQEQPQEAWMSNGKLRVQRLLGKDNLYHKPSDKIMWR